MLSEVATKRLHAMRAYAEFGAGFKIALCDLEIRGAGNELGTEQHGHIESVGYDLYIKLLNQAIAVERGEKVKTEKSDCVIDISVDAFIPDSFISSTANRIEAYKRIASLETPDDVDDLIDELVDRYGDVPDSVMGLIDISLLRVLAASLGITEIVQRKENIIFYGDKFGDIDMMKFLKEIPYKIGINSTNKPFISSAIPRNKQPLQVMNDVLNILRECKTEE